MLTVGFTGSHGKVRYAMGELSRILKQHDAVATGKTLGNRWQQNRFKAPYLREALWKLGYAVDTLETAVDWPKVTSYTRDVEEALRNGLAAEKETVLAFSHLSHLYAQGSSIYTTYVYRVGRTYEDTLSRWSRLKAPRPGKLSAMAAPSVTSTASAAIMPPICRPKKASRGWRSCAPWRATLTPTAA